jgi:hypothetical protein
MDGRKKGRKVKEGHHGRKELRTDGRNKDGWREERK